MPLVFNFLCVFVMNGQVPVVIDINTGVIDILSVSDLAYGSLSFKPGKTHTHGTRSKIMSYLPDPSMKVIFSPVGKQDLNIILKGDRLLMIAIIITEIV